MKNTCSSRLGFALLGGLIFITDPSLANNGSAQTTTSIIPIGSGIFVSILVGLALFGIVNAIASFRKLSGVEQANEDLQNAVRDLRAQVEKQNTIIHIEKHLLIEWDEEETPVVLHNSLLDNEYIPQEDSEISNFSSWLDDTTNYELNDNLLNLLAQGEPFNLVVTTKGGERLEAEGRTAGGRVILKIRDIARSTADIVQLKDEHDKILQSLLDTRKILNLVPVPVWFRDEQGKIEWVNEAYAEAVGISDPALTISAGAELLEKKHLTKVSSTLQEHERFSEKVRLVLGGHQHTVDLNAIRLADGISAGFARDVEHEQTESTILKRFLAVFDQTLGQVSTAIVIFNAQDNLEFYNDAFKKLWNFKDEWLDDHPTSGQMLDQLRLSRQLPAQTDYVAWKKNVLGWHETSDGQTDRWDLPKGQTIYFSALKGFEGGVIYCFENKTDQLTLEQRYHTLNTVQRESLNALSEGVAVFASTGRLKLFNSAFASMWSLDSNKLNEEPHIDEFIEWCSLLYENEVFWNRVKASVTSIEEKRTKFSEKFLRKDGRFLSFNRVPMPEGSTLFTFYDITDTEQKEKALLERNEALESADHIKNSFISNISYELRTPLTSIIGFAEMILSTANETISQKQKEYIQGILLSGRSLESTINDILDLASIDAGKLELNVGEVDTQELLGDVSIEMMPIASKYDVVTKIGLIKTDARAFWADASRMQQVLAHLMSNAIGFTPKGGTVWLMCERSGENIVFKVRDEGPGIPENLKESIFNRFESGIIPGKHRGVGLGLAMVRSLVELHGGTVALYSEVGQGTEAVVTLPRNGKIKLPDLGRKVELLELQDVAHEEKVKSTGRKNKNLGIAS